MLAVPVLIRQVPAGIGTVVLSCSAHRWLGCCWLSGCCWPCRDGSGAELGQAMQEPCAGLCVLSPAVLCPAVDLMSFPLHMRQSCPSFNVISLDLNQEIQTFHRLHAIITDSKEWGTSPETARARKFTTRTSTDTNMLRTSEPSPHPCPDTGSSCSPNNAPPIFLLPPSPGSCEHLGLGLLLPPAQLITKT